MYCVEVFFKILHVIGSNLCGWGSKSTFWAVFVEIQGCPAGATMYEQNGYYVCKFGQENWMNVLFSCNK
jgi:hypothetical protein